jgi:plastocyanin
MNHGGNGAAGPTTRRRPRRLVARPAIVSIAVLVSWPLAAAWSAPNGAIAGVVEVHRPSTPVVQRPNVSDLGMAAHHDRIDRRQSVVYLETAPKGAFEEREGARARMDQRNEAFVPHLLAIMAGTTVDFPNNDHTYHNVFSLSKVHPFDLGRYASGQSKSVRFDRPGIVRVFCDIHSHMSAFILVFSHRFFAVTGEGGRYRIDDVPPGTYTVMVWNELADQVSRTVTVPPDGSTVPLDFVVGREGG